MLKRMKAELRISDRYPNGAVKTTQPRVARLTSQAPSHRVAASRSDKINIRAGCPRPFFASLHPCTLAFLPHSLWLKNQSQSNSIKVNQSESK
jgi:hypothetical protein